MHPDGASSRCKPPWVLLRAGRICHIERLRAAQLGRLRRRCRRCAVVLMGGVTGLILLRSSDIQKERVAVPAAASPCSSARRSLTLSPMLCDIKLMSEPRLPALGLALALTGLYFASPSAAIKPEPARAQSPKMQWKRAKIVDTSVVQRFCRSDGPDQWHVVIFKDRAGDIGGYQASSSIMDSPVHYLDSQGARLTLFHVLGDEHERTEALRVIKALKAEFPVEQPLRCSDYASAPPKRN